MIQRLFCLFTVLLLFLLSGCSRSGETGSQHSQTSSSHSLSGEQIHVEHADGFRITYHENYKLLEILNPYQDMTDTLTYLLVPRGNQPPELDIDVQVIEIPVRSMIATSTTHLALTDMLASNKVIIGMSQPEYVYNGEIRRNLEKGIITEFNGGEFNKEQALAIDPDLIMVSGGQAARMDGFRVLRESGINIMVNSEWLEKTPLGKAEWVKMMGALLNKEGLANRKFTEVERRYIELKKKTSEAESKPLVINNMPYKGAWFVSGGNSFTAQYLKDAGAEYKWFENSSTGGLRLDFEAVYEVGLKAEVWLNPGSATSREDILEQDTRFKAFKAFEAGRIYNNNRRLSSSGGNDFWESGVVRPDLVLADLIKIFHPSMLPEHRLYYYQKLN